MAAAKDGTSRISLIRAARNDIEAINQQRARLELPPIIDSCVVEPARYHPEYPNFREDTFLAVQNPSSFLGLDEVRKTLADRAKLTMFPELPLSPNNVAITNGSIQGLFMHFDNALQPGDKVLCPEGFFFFIRSTSRPH